jgi:CRP-like cAMP-binding protein
MMLDWLLKPTVPQLPVFRALSRTERQSVAEITDRVEFSPGEVLIREGDRDPALWIIVEGRLNVSKETGHTDESLTRLQDGDVFGELGLLDGQPASARITATSPGTALKIQQGKLARFRDIHTLTYYRILREVVLMTMNRIRRMNGLIRELRSDPERTQLRLEAHQRRAEGEIVRTGLLSAVTRPPARTRTRAARPPASIVAKYEPVGYPGAMKTRSAWLRTVPRFRHMSEHALEALAGYAAEMTYDTGARVFGEGDPGDRAFIVAYGTIEVRKTLVGGNARKVHTFVPGDLFGEMALVDGSPRSATCVASSDALLFSFPAEVFNRLFNESSPLAFHFLEIMALEMSQRLRHTDDVFTDIFSAGDAAAIQAALDTAEQELLATGQLEDDALAEALFNLELN